MAMTVDPLAKIFFFLIFKNDYDLDCACTFKL